MTRGILSKYWILKPYSKHYNNIIFMILNNNNFFSGDGINTTEEDIEDMASKSKPPGRVKIP